MYVCYKHTNKFNGKVYVGITSRKPSDRWGIEGRNYASSPYFYSAICKYGWDGFHHEILYSDLTKDEACAKEIELIAYYKSNNCEFGYNMTSGGDCPIMSDMVRAKLSIALRGNKNGFGKVCSKEKAEKISVAQIGKFVSNSTRQKQSEYAKARHVPCSEEKAKKLQNSHPKMRKVYCVETGVVYKSVHECARKLDLLATLVSKVCRNKLKTTGGYHFKYYDDIINA